MKQEYMQAFTEVYEIIKIMPTELVSKIPNKFLEMIKDERDKEYIINIQEPIESQKLKNETIIILGLIYRDFLCSAEDRKKLQERDARELQQVQQEIENKMRQKYNPEDIFNREKKKKEDSQEFFKEQSIAVVKEEKWYNKIFDIIKQIFKK